MHCFFYLPFLVPFSWIIEARGRVGFDWAFKRQKDRPVSLHLEIEFSIYFDHLILFLSVVVRNLKKTLTGRLTIAVSRIYFIKPRNYLDVDEKEPAVNTGFICETIAAEGSIR